MSEKDEVFKQAIKQKGFFNFKELYNFCYGWLKDQGYDVAEEEYSEKNPAAGKEITIKWEAEKKVSDYFKNIISLKWKIGEMNDAEIERNGKKEKINKGSLKIEVTGTLERDYEKRWEDSPTFKFFRGIYDKYIIRTTKEQYEAKLADKADDFVEEIKSFLELEGKK